MITIYARYQAVIGAPDPFLYILYILPLHAFTFFTICLLYTNYISQMPLSGAFLLDSVKKKHGGSSEGRKKWKESRRNWRRDSLLPICLVFLSKLPHQWPFSPEQQLVPASSSFWHPQDNFMPSREANSRWDVSFLRALQGSSSKLLNSDNPKLFPFVSPALGENSLD